MQLDASDFTRRACIICLEVTASRTIVSYYRHTRCVMLYNSSESLPLPMPLMKSKALRSLSACQDTLLHPSLPLLVWLMAAVPKGYSLGRMLALACLNIVHDLATVPVRDHCDAGGLLSLSMTCILAFVHACDTRCACVHHLEVYEFFRYHALCHQHRGTFGARKCMGRGRIMVCCEQGLRQLSVLLLRGRSRLLRPIWSAASCSELPMGAWAAM